MSGGLEGSGCTESLFSLLAWFIMQDLVIHEVRILVGLESFGCEVSKNVLLVLFQHSQTWLIVLAVQRSMQISQGTYLDTCNDIQCSH